MLDFESGELIAELPAGKSSKDGGIAIGDGLAAVRQGESGMIALFDVRDGTEQQRILCPKERYEKRFGIRLAIANGKLFTGQKGVPVIGDSHTPVFQFDLESGEYEKSIWSLRRSYAGDTVFFVVFGLSILIPAGLTLWLLRRKEPVR